MAAVKVLHVEDTPADHDLAMRFLRRAGFEPAAQRVDTSCGLAQALQQPWDVVLLDFLMPSLVVTEALAAVRGAQPDVPIVVLSGALPFAVDASLPHTVRWRRELQKAGVLFISKQRVKDIGSIVSRALAGERGLPTW